jgi:dihydrofolate reductase
MVLAAVVAVDDERGIGKDGDLPWKIPADMAHFKAVTVGTGDNAVIMGRTTWESIPERFRPLRNRINVVLSRRGLEVPDGVEVADSFQAGLDRAQARGATQVFAIGGAQVYEQAMAHPQCEELIITRVEGHHDCDTFFPPWQERFQLERVLEEGESGGYRYHIEVWRRP